MNSRATGLGLLFGFVLSRVGATDYDVIAGLFRLTDLHLLGVAGAAVTVAAVGFAGLRRRGTTRDGRPLALERRPVRPGLVPGGLLFGAGWALAGACPGTALAQIGEGRLAGLATFAGVLFGVWLHDRRAPAPAPAAAARS